MKWKSLFKVALKSIARNRMRSILTMLGIIIGVGAVIVMVAIGQGAQAQIEAQISSLGTNVLLIFPGAGQQGGVNQGAGSSRQFTPQDVDKLKSESTLLAGVSPIIRTGVQAIGGIGNWSTQVYGVSIDYLDIRTWPVVAGDVFSDRDIRGNTKVCLIGKTVADNLFPGIDPVGQQIRLRNEPFKVMGVLAEKGQSATGSDQDDIILAPYTTVLTRLAGGRSINQIMCSAISADQTDAAIAEIQQIMRESHKIPPGGDDDFQVRSQTEIAQTAQATTQTLTLLLASIAGVSLIVGGIGIMNIMLVSVTERTREIGIRMAIGARGSDVLTQFLVESIVISLCGGLVGVLLGIGLATALKTWAGLSTAVNPVVVLLAFGFSGAVGVFFGFYPARKASALNPIEALRYE